MKNSFYLAFVSLLPVLVSSPVLAHTTGSSSGILHAMTGEHLLMVGIVACVVVLAGLYRRSRQ